MHDTGRIKKTLDPEMQSLVFKAPNDTELNSELGYITKVDQAHVLMLLNCGLISDTGATRLLKEIVDLESSAFTPLRGSTPVRGLYLMYENYLIERLGDGVGGMLQIGRSRNDISATIAKLKARKVLVTMVESGLDLLAAFQARADDLKDVVLPAHTHYQPALPITLEHYFHAVSEALLRDIQALMDIEGSLNLSPLGAGAGGGTTMPIDPTLTAALLGFTSLSRNSIDAVASRDYMLRMLSAAAILGLTLSRCAADLILWSTHEFRFIRLPDDLVGSSSMMPQKRNPFLLEHVKGRTGSPLAAFQRSLMAMHAVPYGNSVSVGTEAMRGFEEAMEEVCSSMLILGKHIHLMEPDRERMREVAVNASVCATSVAEHLVMHSGMSFRSAHYQVGKHILEAESVGENGVNFAAKNLCREIPVEEIQDQFSPEKVVGLYRYGAGPGACAFVGDRHGFRDAMQDIQRRIKSCTQRWDKADQNRKASVQKLINDTAFTEAH